MSDDEVIRRNRKAKKEQQLYELQQSEASTSRPQFNADSSDEETPQNPDESETAGIRRKGQGMRSVNLGGNVGAWEKHTKGIGAKLLLQMGYQPGMGLGKDLQGISAPIEATVRKGRGAIGAYGPEKSAQKEVEKRLKENKEQEKGTKEKNYNWKKSQKGRYFTQEGTWAKDSDEDDNEDNIRKKVRKPKDFSAPIGFVAGGVQQEGKKKEAALKKELQQSEASTSCPQFNADSSDEKTPKNPDESETAGIRRKGQGMRSVNLGGNVGAWEKHTKGIGAKLLLQMGYQPGMGLGKDLQGISAPIEATVRKGRGAIGAYGPEKSAQKAKKEVEKRLKENKEQEKGTKENNYNWKKSHKGRYFTQEELQQSEASTSCPQFNADSSDEETPQNPDESETAGIRRKGQGMRSVNLGGNVGAWEKHTKGIGAKLLLQMGYQPGMGLGKDLQGISAPIEATVRKGRGAIGAYGPEKSADIIQNARELQSAEDEIVVLERDLEEYDIKLREKDRVLSEMKEILKRVELLNRPDISLESAYDILAELKELYPTGYKMFGVGLVARNIVSPLLSALLATWEPLRAPDEHIPTFLKWRELLTETAYNELLSQHFVPKMSGAAEKWNPREPTAMLSCVEAWQAASPAWLLQSVVARCVVARVLAAVRAWDPTHDTQPLHLWVLPWHNLAGNALTTAVYPLIRSRLSAVLSAWHPADGSARGVLSAWRLAWGAALTNMLHEHIVPKLDLCLQHAPLELVGRENTAWLWCMEWLELLGPAALANIAARSLLPRWLGALAAWLNTNPPHATVLNSYTDFKKMFPEEVLKEPAVRDAFRKALDMMNRSADLDNVEPPPPPRFTLTEGNF